MRLWRKRVSPAEVFTPEWAEGVRKTLMGRDEAQDVETPAQDVDLGLIPYMPYVLYVDGKTYARGTVQEIHAAVAEFVTTLLAAHPVTLATDAQMLNLAFTGGDVENALIERGEWETLFGIETPQPVRLKVVTA